MRAEAFFVALCLCETIALAAALHCSLGVLRNRRRSKAANNRELGALSGLCVLIAGLFLSHADCLARMLAPDIAADWPKLSTIHPTRDSILLHVAQIGALTLLARPFLERLFGKDWMVISALVVMLIITGAGALELTLYFSPA